MPERADVSLSVSLSTHPGNPRGMTTEERFWEKVDRSGDCWRWKGGKVGPASDPSGGYGRFATSTTRGNVVLVLPHRFSWELHFGPIPAGLNVLHACDTPACIRPTHLLLGTHTANMIDAARKGRMHQQVEARARRDAA